MVPPGVRWLSRMLTQTFELRNEAKAPLSHIDDARKEQLHSFSNVVSYLDGPDPLNQDQNKFILNIENKLQRFFEKIDWQV